MVKTRFAPSPTGKPHVGNIRTAIFDYLQAKSVNGQFILRIEDTDRERFVPEAVEYIKQALLWLGLKWDNEEVIHQSSRLKIYQSHASQLVREKKAYQCYCSKERLERLRQQQIKEKKPPGYDNCCRNLSILETKKYEEEGIKPVIRFRIPDEPTEICWNDKIRGKICIRAGILEDFVIIKSDGYPTYNFANIIDDHDQEISLVIRGEEFIPSNPKHLLLYSAFGWTPPDFAHMPLIIGKDRSKLSKRHGDTAILDYREKGYLPEAMLNFLALLGWNDGTTQELFTMTELKKKFSIDRVGRAPAIFDIDRLNWINGEKIRAMSIDELYQKVSDFQPDFFHGKDLNLAKRALSVTQTRMVTLLDYTQSDYFFKKPDYETKILIFAKSDRERTKTGLEKIAEKLNQTADLKNATQADQLLQETVSENKLTNGDVFWPVRAALSGREKSPSPGELMWALGPEESRKRIAGAIAALGE